MVFPPLFGCVNTTSMDPSFSINCDIVGAKGTENGIVEREPDGLELPRALVALTEIVYRILLVNGDMRYSALVDCAIEMNPLPLMEYE